MSKTWSDSLTNALCFTFILWNVVCYRIQYEHLAPPVQQYLY